MLVDPVANVLLAYWPMPNAPGVNNYNSKNIVYDQAQTVISFTDAIRPSLFLELNTSFICYTINRSLPDSGFNPTAFGLSSYFDELCAKYLSCFPTVSITGQGGQVAGCYILPPAHQIYND